MLTDGEMQTAMLQNKQYPNIGPACATLKDMADKLEKLNEGPAEEKLCDVEALSRIRAHCDKSSDVAMSTYLLFFALDRLPSIEDLALRKAELDSVRLSLTEKLGGGVELWSWVMEMGDGGGWRSQAAELGGRPIPV